MISNCNTTEHFTDDNTPITAANISDYIYKVYKADVKAIQNLADIAIKLQAGGITVPGSMTVSNQLNVLNGISLTNNLTFNQGGRKIILYNGNPDNNMNPDGLYLHFYNTGGGWISNPLVINEGLMRIPQDLTVGGNIRGPTIDDLYKQIKALQDRCAALQDRCAALEGKTQHMGNSLGNNSTVFDGPILIFRDASRHASEGCVINWYDGVHVFTNLIPTNNGDTTWSGINYWVALETTPKLSN